ncbi:pyrimidine reductase family protein, partial [Streptomyces sp. MCAF7]
MRRLFPLPTETPAEPSSGEDREWGLGELADAYAYPDLPAGPGGPG